ncbi:MAG: sugar transferase [Vitreimonas sp.]
MLIQLPSESSDLLGPRNAEECSPFEAGLRRDLASAPIVSYDVMLGGAAKRAIDLALALSTMPLWLVALGASAAWAKLRHGGRVFLAEECIGYGGRTFRCLALCMTPPATDGEADRAETEDDGWSSALERLPQFFNVIAGDMALVGPRPLTRGQLEPLRTARRYYLSARPGVIGVRVLAGAGREDPSHYKTYAMAWSLATDALIVSDHLGALWSRASWRPVFSLEKIAAWMRPRRPGAVAPEATQDTL